MSVDAFINASNIVLLLAYTVRDILWLRLLAVSSSLLAIPYFALQPTPQRVPMSWSVVFAGLNLFQSWRLFLERRPVKLTQEEEEVRQLAFPNLSPRKVLQILSIGSWNTVEPGARLLENGKPADAMSLIVRGKVRVSKEGRVLGELGAGDVVGSALLLSGAVADVDAMAVEPVRNVRWLTETFERYLHANPDTRIVLQQYLAHDLASKVRRMSSTMPPLNNGSRPS
jgi:CRP-like cAMP-binding protein